MRIGRSIDRLVDTLIIMTGNAANRWFETYLPLQVSERAKIAAADELADVEAERDSWEPDDLWAASMKVHRPFEDTDDFAEPLGEYPDVTLDCPAGVVPPPTDTSRTNNIAAIRSILDDRIDSSITKPYDRWLTETAVEILNALQK